MFSVAAVPNTVSEYKDASVLDSTVEEPKWDLMYETNEEYYRNQPMIDVRVLLGGFNKQTSPQSSN